MKKNKSIDWKNYDPNDFYDELIAAKGNPRPAATAITDYLGNLGSEEIQARQQAVCGVLGPVEEHEARLILVEDEGEPVLALKLPDLGGEIAEFAVIGEFRRGRTGGARGVRQRTQTLHAAQ